MKEIQCDNCGHMFESDACPAVCLNCGFKTDCEIFNE